MEYKVEVSGERIDKYLGSITELSRNVILNNISNGNILVNGKIVKKSYKLKENDLITVNDISYGTLDVTPKEMPLDIVFENEDLMIINKPSGLTVHPGAGNTDNTLVNGLMAYTSNLSDLSGENRLGIVHRIDKDTSGLMMVVKNNETHNIMAERFKNKEIKREYIALLVGEFKNSSATIDAPIGRDPLNRKMYTVTDKNSKKAVTNMWVLKRYHGYTLVKCLLETGRTHQIRVHMKYIGYPIYNDPVYGKKGDDFGQFLHSSHIEFVNPKDNKLLSFDAPLPKEFQEFIDSLEEY